MELRHLRYFTAVARAGSFARAAHSLRVAQPALSKQVRDLEREVAAELLRREPRGARLTAEGETMARLADAVLASVDRLLDAATLARRGMLGRCRIAVGPLPLLGARIGVALAAVQRRFPDIELEVREVPSADHPRVVRAGDADIAIGVPPAPVEPGVDSAVFYEDPWDSAAIASSHPLAKRESVTTKQLRSIPLVLLARKALPHVMGPTIDALRRKGFTRIEEADTLTTVAALVATRKGWTVVTHSQRGRAVDGYAVVPIDDLRVPLTMNITLREGEKSRVVHNVARTMHDARLARWRLSAVAAAPPDETNAGEKGRAAARLALELRHLRAFVTCLDERNLTRAAQRLGLSQPGLSRRLADFERILGVELFERTPSGINPTATAAFLERRMRETLELADGIPARVKDARKGVRANIRIGVVALAGGTIMPGIMAALASGCAHVHVTFVNVHSPRQPRALESGEIDLGIVHPLPGLRADAAIDGARLWDDVIDSVLVHAGHRLATRSAIRAADLADEPAIFTHPHFDRGFHDLVIGAFRQLGLEPKVAGTYHSLRTMWSVAATGVGWMIAARSQRDGPPAGLVLLPVEGLSIPWGFDLIWRSGERSADVIEAIKVIQHAPLPPPIASAKP